MEFLRRIVLTIKRFGIRNIVFISCFFVCFILINCWAWSSANTASDNYNDNYSDKYELHLSESYEIVSVNIQTNIQANGNLSGVYLLGSGTISGSISTTYSPIYHYWYKRNDGGIISSVIDFSNYSFPDAVQVVVYEDDETEPKLEIWRNAYAENYGDGSSYSSSSITEFRFFVPVGTFVNDFNFQDISPKT